MNKVLATIALVLVNVNPVVAGEVVSDDFMRQLQGLGSNSHHEVAPAPAEREYGAPVL